MMRGEVDLLYEVGPEALEFMQRRRPFELYPFLRSYVFGIVLQFERVRFPMPKSARP